LNALQFQLLGNRFETLHLPSAIVLVEGRSDLAFINRLLSLRFPSNAISVISCGNDNRIKEVVSVAKQMLGELGKSPYAERIFAVLDSVHAPGLPNDLANLGLAQENIVQWSVNGIEHLYPRSLLEQHFGAFDSLSIDDDNVSANGITMRKQALAEYVIGRMTGHEPLDPELETRLIGPLRRVLQ
jgi:hypothetical protein